MRWVPLVLLTALSICAFGRAGALAANREVLIRGPTMVTMDGDHSVIREGRLLIRDNEIAAVWGPGSRPKSVGRARVRRAIAIEPGSTHTYVFPGMINLHDHPAFDALNPWPPPSSDAIPEAGKTGTDPYDNRYEWNTDGPDEQARLISNPSDALADLGLWGESVKYAEVEAMLGGETSMQGASLLPEADGLMVRNIESNVFNPRIAQPRVRPISAFDGGALQAFLDSARSGAYDAWMVHLAEGVADSDRRPGDPVSSRAEFGELVSKGLLSDITVIIHGLALERPDFAAMRAAGAPGPGATDDGLGSKLVWSPRSNLQLYGETANVYAALAEHVLVSLGTDWTPSGSANLLGELKVADRALRDRRLLGRDRSLVPRLADERRLDRALVDMAIRNPARTLHGERYVGSIERGKRADLFVLRRPAGRPRAGLPRTPYRALIDAHERDVKLVLIDGNALVGGERAMGRLSPGDYERIEIPGGVRAIDVTEPGVPAGDQRFSEFSADLRAGLQALGGDNPPPGGGPAPPGNTYSYLKVHLADGALAGSSDSEFRAVLTALYGLDSAGRLNIESVGLIPPVDGANDFLRALLNGRLDRATGLLDDPSPPFGLYPANLNYIGRVGNPLAGLP